MRNTLEKNGERVINNAETGGTIRKQVRKLGKPVKLIGYNLRLSPISVGYIIG